MNGTTQQAGIRASDENKSLKPTLKDGSIEKHELHDFWEFDHSAGKFNMVRFSPVHRIDVLTRLFAQASKLRRRLEPASLPCLRPHLLLTCMRVLGWLLWLNSAQVAEAGSQVYDEGSWSHRKSTLRNALPQRPSSSVVSYYKTQDAGYTKIWYMLRAGSNRISELRDPQEPPLPCQTLMPLPVLRKCP